MEAEQMVEETHKKGRQRKKLLYNSILQQMEFYFGDSNLNKDRFLGGLLKETEYVDLEIFLKFNKIRKLTTSLDDIVKSLKKSTLLELSEDKKKVKRASPVQTKLNTEDCTIYVENIKSETTHDWLKNVFSEFGNVTYVSIPKYRHNKLNKGFAFIEFEDESEAKEAICYFDSIKSLISSHIEPDSLASIASFDKEKVGDELMDDDEGSSNKRKSETQNGGENAKKQKVEGADQNCGKAEDKDGDHKVKKNKDEKEDSGQNKKVKKVTVKDSDGSDENCRKFGEEKLNAEEENEDAQNKKVKKQKVKDSEEDNNEENHKAKKQKMKDLEEDNNAEIEGNQKIKKVKAKDSEDNEENHKVKKQKINDSKMDNNEEIEENLNVEKQKVEGKEDVEADKDENKEKVEESEAEGQEGEVKKKKKKSKKKSQIKEMGLQILPKKDWRILRNRYLNMQRNKMKQLKQHLNKFRFSNRYESTPNTQASQENSVESKLSFTPGVIIKLLLNEPYAEAKKLKAELKSQPDVQFVDVPPSLNNDTVFLRFSSDTSASSFSSKNEHGTAEVLHGDEEKNYWDKIQNKMSVKTKKDGRKQRGRNKLLKKAEHALGKHIRFDDD